MDLWAGGMPPKCVGPDERRGNIAERSEKRETSTTKIRRSKDAKGRIDFIADGPVRKPTFK